MTTASKYWLGTAAIALAMAIGSGGAIAQGPSDMKHEGARGAQPSAESSREASRPGAEAKGSAAGPHAAQSETKQSAQEPRRGEASPGREQATERPSRDSRQTVGQGSGPGAAKDAAQSDKAGPGAAQSDKAEHSTVQRDRDQRDSRDAKESAETKRQQGQADERKGDNRAAETSRSGQPNQRQDREADRHDRNSTGSTQQSQDERKGPDRAAEKQGTERNNQAAQPNRPDNTGSTAQQNTQPGQATGQAQNQPDRNRSNTKVSVNDQQRTQVIDRLRRDRDIDQARTDININVNVGERLPERVRPRPLPSDIVSIVPEYRGYEYTVVHDDIAIIDPHSREIVDVIPERGGYTSADRYGGGYGSTRVTLSDEQRQILLRSATSTGTVGSTSTSSGSSSSGSTCLSLRRVPDELARSNPELASYQYLAIGDQVVLVDPQNQKVVQVIDQQQ
ncbi:conserved exported hypothetical protein [Bradyrhizobium sp. STM 3843]|uniref:DUF1236 domain-containing protein n=1 Tax=Bradyrhizobium sp. STM 3843 TaxID=551947 RepID=UPI000240505C|nr:DUF1236 domain-containing protein [Bradyrhizobium sp. STM 3843]CCE11791.1 conserved exported hypothetical protein [Bradyrhizobium sp. STM 3843]